MFVRSTVRARQTYRQTDSHTPDMSQMWGVKNMEMKGEAKETSLSALVNLFFINTEKKVELKWLHSGTFWKNGSTFF